MIWNYITLIYFKHSKFMNEATPAISFEFFQKVFHPYPTGVSEMCYKICQSFVTQNGKISYTHYIDLPYTGDIIEWGLVLSCLLPQKLYLLIFCLSLLNYLTYLLTCPKFVLPLVFSYLKSHVLSCYTCLAQWTHLRRFAIDSTSKFHVENSSIFHRFWKANPRGNYDIDSTWKIRRGFDFQNRSNIDEFSTWIFRCLSNVKST